MFDDILRADYDFYKNTYRGTESEDIITDALEQAAMQVFAATFCRTKISKLTQFQSQMAKMAICEQAEYFINTDDVPVDGVTAYSIGDVSISFDTSKTSKNFGICDKARSYLLPTNLLNRSL